MKSLAPKHTLTSDLAPGKGFFIHHVSFSFFATQKITNFLLGVFFLLFLSFEIGCGTRSVHCVVCRS